MPSTTFDRIFRSLAAVLSLTLLAGVAPASFSSQASATELGRYTNLPLPRYVSLKSSRVNLRNGPSREHKVNWLYLKAGLPVEIVQEFDQWRRIRDQDGTEGWVYQSLLSGDRTAVAAPWLKGKAAYVDVFASPAGDAPLVARMEPGVVSNVSKCSANWCEIRVSGRVGHVRQTDIWGVYPGETVGK